MLRLWRTNCDGYPTHPDVASETLTEEQFELFEDDPDVVLSVYRAPVTVHPSGAYTHADGLNMGYGPHEPSDRAAGERTFAQVVGGLRFVSDADEFDRRYGDGGAYGHAHRLAAL